MALCGALCYGALAARYPRGGRRLRLPARGVRAARRVPVRLEVLPGHGSRDHGGARVRDSPATSASSCRSAPVALAGRRRRRHRRACAAVHIVGVRPGTRLLATLAVLKLVLVGGADVCAAFASTAGDWQHFSRSSRGVPARRRFGAALAGALVAAFFSFGGWWEVTKIAGEVRDPSRTHAARAAARPRHRDARLRRGDAGVHVRHPDRAGRRRARRSSRRSARCCSGARGGTAVAGDRRRRACSAASARC